MTPRGPTPRWRTPLIRGAVAAVAMLVLAGFVWLRVLPHGLALKRQPVTVVRISDGDSLAVRTRSGLEVRVRLLGIDTPELGHADGFRAALYTAELVEQARTVELEPEVTTSGVAARDRYGRVLGWIWVRDARGRELLLNEELVRLGYATLYQPVRHGKYLDRLRQAASALLRPESSAARGIMPADG